MPDTNIPTLPPGTKPSAPQANTGDPRAKTDKASVEEESAANRDDKDTELTAAEKAHLAVHASALQKLVGKVSAPAGDTGGNLSNVNDEVNKAVATAPGRTSDY